VMGLLLDYNLFADIIRYVGQYTDDVKKAKQNAKKSK
jgi:hypothetical protein